MKKIALLLFVVSLTINAKKNEVNSLTNLQAEKSYISLIKK